MTHKEIYKKFQELLPDYGPKVITWYGINENKKADVRSSNKIRLRLFDMTEFIFSYYGPKRWRFETVESFQKTSAVKGERT